MDDTFTWTSHERCL
uniref:Uncharacterized protein n=1 Tax=Anguilla anguilla TaxID=7936 RepID=A0A0E9XBT3_ANGAN